MTVANDEELNGIVVSPTVDIGDFNDSKVAAIYVVINTTMRINPC